MDIDDPRWEFMEEEFVKSADGKETSHTDNEATILNLIQENNRREAEIERLRAWAEDEQRGRHKAEKDRMECRSENERLQAELWHVREGYRAQGSKSEPHRCPKCGTETRHYCAMVCVDICPKCDTLDARCNAARAPRS